MKLISLAVVAVICMAAFLFAAPVRTAGTTANPHFLGTGSAGSNVFLSWPPGSGAAEWTTVSGGGITSITLTAPAFMSVTGSPLTSSGTLALAYASGLTGNEYEVLGVNGSGNVGLLALTGAFLPDPSASTLGGVESLASAPHEWINGISTSGVPSAAQPGFSDISGMAAVGQGGTGATGTPANGELLIGNGSTYTPAAITPGTGISVTNGSGSITIAATGAGESLPTDYISGLQLSYIGTGSGYGEVGVGTGTAQVPGGASSVVVGGITGTYAGANGTYTFESGYDVVSGTCYVYSGWYLGGAIGTSGSPSYGLIWASPEWQLRETIFGDLAGAGALFDNSTGSAAAPWTSGTWTASLGAGTLSAPVPSYGTASPTTVTLSSALTWNPTSTTYPAASAFVYFYLTSSGALEESSAAPQVPYQGNARIGLDGSRYVGCALVSSGNDVYQFTTTMGGGGYSYVFQPTAGTTAAPFEVLTSGTATSVASISCASVIPTTATAAWVQAVNRSYSASAGCGAQVGAYAASLSEVFQAPPAFGTSAWMWGNAMGLVPMNPAETVGYLINNSPSGSGLQLDVFGFTESR